MIIDNPCRVKNNSFADLSAAGNPGIIRGILNKITSFKLAFSYLESFTNLERKSGLYSETNYRLDRMRFLLSRFGNPQDSFSSIHVAGSKGKGSVSHLLSAALTSHGLRTGLYTSPHVFDFRERIQIDGRFPQSGPFLRIINRVRSFLDNTNAGNFPFEAMPTTFELLTLSSLLYFREMRCSHAVLETGIGGRLDATNCVTPFACVITPIDLEHQDILGATIREIAGEKAGIIKPGIPVFSAAQDQEAADVIRSAAARNGSPLRSMDREIVQIGTDLGAEGTACRVRFRENGEIHFSLSLLGGFQAENAALAYLTLKTILPGFSRERTLQGFEKVKIPARMEIVKRNPVVLLDGGHTPLAVRRVLSSFLEIFPGKGILIFGCLKGKNAAGMAEILCPAFDEIIVSKPTGYRESDPEEVYGIFRERNEKTVLLMDPARALSRALDLSGGKRPILVTGSFYMVSEIRKLLSHRDQD
jgi:dihydrofolate synthase/folylpolyglutamate synthase